MLIVNIRGIIILPTPSSQVNRQLTCTHYRVLEQMTIRTDIQVQQTTQLLCHEPCGYPVRWWPHRFLEFIFDSQRYRNLSSEVVLSVPQRSCFVFCLIVTPKHQDDLVPRSFHSFHYRDQLNRTWILWNTLDFEMVRTLIVFVASGWGNSSRTRVWPMTLG